MQPLGKYIAITKPKALNTFVIDTGEEKLVAANVLACSPDTFVPFKPLSMVTIYKGKVICIDGNYFVDVDHIPVWIDHESVN